MRRAATGLAVLLLCLGLVAGCAAGAPVAPAGPLRIATGSSGGVYYLYGKAISKVLARRVPQLRSSVLETNASLDNVRMVVAGTAEVAFTQADIIDLVLRTSGPGTLTTLARLYDDYLHLVVRADSPINQLTDLRGLRVSIGAAGSGTAETVKRLLSVASLDPQRDIVTEQLNLNQSADALRAGSIDAFFFSGGLPVQTVLELTVQTPIRLVSIGGYAQSMRTQFGPYYTVHTVPTSAYHLPVATTIGVPNYLVVAGSMPEGTAYAVVRALFSDRATLEQAHPEARRLNVREAISTFPLPLHPGALRWYRENKP